MSCPDATGFEGEDCEGTEESVVDCGERPSLSWGTRSNWSCVGPSESASRKEYSESALFGEERALEEDMSRADGNCLLSERRRRGRSRTLAYMSGAHDHLVAL